ncbi:MAG: NAD(P)-dependent oxidoreductase [Polyangiaceae bacterium]
MSKPFIRARETCASLTSQRILITGSSGLLGSALATALLAEGTDVVCLDVRAHGEARGDVRDPARLHEVVDSVDGVIHLAAVSRVIWGEKDPELCWATNVGGLDSVLQAARRSARTPWLIFASSREVYGQPERLPASEDCPLRPMNVYARSKVAGEMLVEEARRSGVRACTVRLSNVFGTTSDHADRVVPAFARAAAFGRELRVEGLDHTFDFTHIDDVTRGLGALTALLAAGDPPPAPIQFVTGRPTTLGELARIAVRCGQSTCTIRPSAPRHFDVAHFVGDWSRARSLLGWQPQVELEQGVARLVRAFRESHQTADLQEVAQ